MNNPWTEALLSPICNLPTPNKKYTNRIYEEFREILKFTM